MKSEIDDNKNNEIINQGRQVSTRQATKKKPKKNRHHHRQIAKKKNRRLVLINYERFDFSFFHSSPTQKKRKEQTDVNEFGQLISDNQEG